jgi:hypothetical protein
MLVGYTQLFAHLYRGTTFDCNIKKIKGTGHDQSVVIKATELEDIYVEEEEKEEDERISLKGYSDYTYALFYAGIHSYFFQRATDHSPCGYFSCLTFFKSPYLIFRVLRL